MTNTCKCGHVKMAHKGDECHRSKVKQFTKQCTCKKFEPQNEPMAELIRDKHGKLKEIREYRPKNHSQQVRSKEPSKIGNGALKRPTPAGTNDFNLSEKICGDDKAVPAIIYLKDIKEFIKKLNKLSKKGWEGYIGLVHIEDIKKLAGEDLK